jgi:uncharacterized membrane-anchored protein
MPAALSRAVASGRVPEVTIYFWLIKILATTVGETAADFLNETLGFGLNGTSVVMTVLLVVVLAAQFRSRRYVPAVYWLAVVLVSIVGTLVTDNLTDNLGVPLPVTTAAFAVGLALAFTAWFASERTLSIHTIYTARREAFYWLTILLTFALGTAAGDLLAERLAFGYFPSALLFGGVIAVITAIYYGFKTNAVLAFWAAYVVTRPFGASMGDFLTAPTKDGGLGLGTNGTSALFIAIIVACVAWFTLKDRRNDRELVTVAA